MNLSLKKLRNALGLGVIGLMLSPVVFASGPAPSARPAAVNSPTAAHSTSVHTPSINAALHKGPKIPSRPPGVGTRSSVAVGGLAKK